MKTSFKSSTSYTAPSPLERGLRGEAFSFERIYKAPLKKVWQAITDKEKMKQWYFDLAEFKAEIDFEFRFLAGEETNKYLHICKVTEVVPEKKLTYSWRYDGYPGNSFVTFELSAQGKKTKLKLTHAGLESFLTSNNPDLDPKNFAEGWTQIIGTSLKKFVEKPEKKPEVRRQ